MKSSPEISREILQTIVSKRSKKKAPGAGRVDYVALFFILLVILISVFTLPEDWSVVRAQHVWYYGWITAVSTGAGVLPFFFFSEPNKYWMGISNGMRHNSDKIYLNLLYATSLSHFLSYNRVPNDFSCGGRNDAGGLVQPRDRGGELRAGAPHAPRFHHKHKYVDFKTAFICYWAPTTLIRNPLRRSALCGRCVDSADCQHHYRLRGGDLVHFGHQAGAGQWRGGR